MSRVEVRRRSTTLPGELRRVVAAGLLLLLCVAPRPAAAEGSDGAASPRPLASASQPPSEPIPLLAFLFGAIGLSGVSVGATTGFLALNQKSIAEDHCSQTLHRCDATGRAANDTGRTLRDVSTAGWLIGGLGVGLGAYLWLSAPTRDHEIALAVQFDGAGPKAALVARY